MVYGSYLGELRRQAGLTQRELAEQVGFEASYGQKRISQFESDIAKPTPDEMAKLAKALKTPRAELESYFTDPATHSALKLFTRLAETKNPALMTVCYSGPPKILMEASIRSKILEAMSRNLYLAMFVPFPLGSTGDTNTDDGASLLLSSYYSRVWGSVLASREKLKTELGAKIAEKHVGLFGPCRQTEPGLLIPPFLSRYVLLHEKEEDGHYSRSLYLWVETLHVKRMQIIGTDEDDVVRDQLDSWEAFFGSVISSWCRDNQIPKANCGYWQYRDDSEVRVREKFSIAHSE